MNIKALLLCFPAILTAQVAGSPELPLQTWATPLFWQPTETEARASGFNPEIRDPEPRAAAPAGSLAFVPMQPCRVVDTRASQGFPGAFGLPGLSVYPSIRTFPMQLSTKCSIPSMAQAYSLNVTIIPNPIGTPVGYVTLYPTAAAPNTPPTFVTLDDVTGDIRNNAAIVPAGISNGSISAVTNGAGSPDLVIDINGYFAAQTGFTLPESTAATPPLNFSGDAGTGISSLALGTLSLDTGGVSRLTVGTDGDIEIAPGNIRKNGVLFLHNLAFANTGIGLNALHANTAANNTALGQAALLWNVGGFTNTAMGLGALEFNTAGFQNTAVGRTTVTLGGNDNTVVGFNSGQEGNGNTALGVITLDNVVRDYNIAVGYNTASTVVGHNNISIGPVAGQGADNNVIRIGFPSLQSLFFAAGIAGVTVGNQTGVLISTTTNQLGTVSSSARYKQDITEMSEASSGLLRLRPVTFRYRKAYADGPKPLDYGLIAEEVAEVYPDLVARNSSGEVETVEYHKLPAMLLNEVQKEHRAIDRNHEAIRLLQDRVAALRAAIELLSTPKSDPAGSPAR